MPANTLAEPRMLKNMMVASHRHQHP